MHSAAYLVDAALSIGLQLDAKIEIRNDVERGELVEQVTAVDGVHAPEDHIAARHGANGVRIEKVPGVGFDDGAEIHSVDSACSDIDLEPAALCILHCGVQNSVEVFFFDAVRIHQDDSPDAVPRQLFDQRAAGTRAAHDADTQVAETVVGPGAE